MNLTINIPDNIAPVLINRVCIRFGYQDTIYNPDFNPDLPEDQQTNPSQIINPETKQAFSKRMVIQMLKKIYQQGAIKERLAEIKNDLDEL